MYLDPDTDKPCNVDLKCLSDDKYRTYALCNIHFNKTIGPDVDALEKRRFCILTRFVLSLRSITNRMFPCSFPPFVDPLTIYVHI